MSGEDTTKFINGLDSAIPKGTDSSTVMSILATNFGTYPDTPLVGTRYIGGHRRKISPLINGYFQFFINLPTIFKNVSNTWVTCSCETWTPPTRTLTTGDVPGQGGLGSTFVTGQTLTRTFTTTHREYNNLPVNKLFRIWSNTINTYTGVSEIGGADWDQAPYKTDGYIIKTKPVAQVGVGNAITQDDIEDIWYFTGLFPEGDGEDGLGDDINSPDIAGTYSITWHFDGYPFRGRSLFSKISNNFENVYSETPTRMLAAIQ
jgi:hypothetical protein